MESGNLGSIRQVRPVVRIVAVFSQNPAAFDWVLAELQDRWGPVSRESTRYAFNQTEYYERSMGPKLLKQLFSFQQLMAPGLLVSSKHISNQLEEQFLSETIEPSSVDSNSEISRPINIDPGYCSEAKLVLATTKDRDHRIYLSDGIFAEVTLFYRHGKWQPRPWTYADYQQQELHNFLTDCRNDLREAYKRNASELR